MATQESVAHEEYYVPASSGMAISATIGLVLAIIGAARMLNDMTFGEPGAQTSSGTIFTVGLLWLIATLFIWFRTTIRENIAGMNSAQLKNSYAIGMFWFIFSEVMFFFVFFGALFYVRVLVGPWLAGEGEGGAMNHLLWPGFEFSWPTMITPQQAVGGAAAQAIANNGTFVGPDTSMAFAEVEKWWHWLPMWNTIILMTSSVTVHIAHLGLLNGDRSKFNLWLGISVALACIFLFLQYEEYHEAYVLFGLTLDSGIYGSTFFMLTGFHGFHVALGMTMLLVQLLRSVWGGQCTADDHFGFEASSWYWHFVDVVWLMLFLFVYIL